jgi:hypothetical protein
MTARPASACCCALASVPGVFFACLGDDRQVGVVRKPLQHRQFHARRHPEQHVGAAGTNLVVERLAVEAAVEDDQHVLVQIDQHLLGQVTFPGAAGTQSGGDDRVRAALAEAD